jgi:quinoprotein glucose dehydrogenase
MDTGPAAGLALDGATGKQLWKFDCGIVGRLPSRGLSYWTDGKQSRLFAYIMNFLYALDPATGEPVAGFGEGGRLDMRKDLDSDYTQNSVVLTTPGVIYKDELILGFRAPETNPAPHGDIRAYNVRTGKLEWSFHTIPHPGEPGYETWPEGAWNIAGAANNRAGMAVVSSAASCSFQPDLRFPIFTDSTAWVMIFTPTACSRSTPEPAR